MVLGTTKSFPFVLAAGPPAGHKQLAERSATRVMALFEDPSVEDKDKAALLFAQFDKNKDGATNTLSAVCHSLTISLLI